MEMFMSSTLQIENIDNLALGLGLRIGYETWVTKLVSGISPGNSKHHVEDDGRAALLQTSQNSRCFHGSTKIQLRVLAASNKYDSLESIKNSKAWSRWVKHDI